MLRVQKASSAASLPERASEGAAGYDLRSAQYVAVPARGRVREPQAPGKGRHSRKRPHASRPPQALVTTGLIVAVPPGTYGRVAPRSGLALHRGIDVGAGVIDADYRGQLGVLLFNHSDADFFVAVGDRVAQLILEVVRTPPLEEASDLGSELTGRGASGFGSTGVS